MATYLVVAEKHSVAKTIASALGKWQFSKDDAGMPLYEVNWRGDKYIITYAQGHIFSLADAEQYNPDYKKWDFDMLPIIPNRFELSPVKSASKRIKAIKGLLKKRGKEIDAVINATDAGREGELIFAYIKQALGIKHPVKRLWLQAMTPDAIRKAFNELIPGEEMQNLEQAARARSEADWIVGINATRGVTVLASELYSIGRVQTPTLAILVNREKEIQNFKPEDFYSLKALINLTPKAKQKPPKDVYITGKIVLQPDLDKKDPWRYRIKPTDKSNKEALKLLEALDGAKNLQATVVDYKEKSGSTSMKTVFKLSTFQTACSSYFGWTAQKALNILQSLYEKGYVSYPRTDSDYLPTAMKAEVPKLIKSSLSWLGMEEVPLVDINKHRVFNDKKISDHYGIVPTGTLPKDGDLTPDEQKAYELVVRRFIATFMPPAKYINHQLTLEIKKPKALVEATYTTYEDPGYLAIYHYEWNSKWNSLPTPKDNVGTAEKLAYFMISYDKFNKGEQAQIEEIAKEKGQTKPPSRYTDGSLIKAMEHAGRFVEDDDMAKQLKGKGIGTPATRAAIIETLIKRGYVKRKGKTLIPTDKGIALIDTLHQIGLDILTDPLMTAQWEEALERIEEGKESKANFDKNIRKMIQAIITILKDNSGTVGGLSKFKVFKGKSRKRTSYRKSRKRKITRKKTKGKK